MSDDIITVAGLARLLAGRDATPLDVAMREDWIRDRQFTLPAITKPATGEMVGIHRHDLPHWVEAAAPRLQTRERTLTSDEQRRLEQAQATARQFGDPGWSL